MHHPVRPDPSAGSPISQYNEALKLGALVLDLYSKAKNSVRQLLDPADSEVQNVRLKSCRHELICSQSGHYTFICQQSNAKHGDGEGMGGEGGEEGGGETKAAD